MMVSYIDIIPPLIREDTPHTRHVGNPLIVTLGGLEIPSRPFS